MVLKGLYEFGLLDFAIAVLVDLLEDLTDASPLLLADLGEDEVALED